MARGEQSPRPGCTGLTAESADEASLGNTRPPGESLPPDLESLRSAIREGRLFDGLWSRLVDPRVPHAVLNRYADALSGLPEASQSVLLLRGHAALRQRRYPTAIAYFKEASPSANAVLSVEDWLAYAEALRGAGEHSVAALLLAGRSASAADDEFTFWQAVCGVAAAEYERAAVLLADLTQPSRHARARADWLRAYLAVALAQQGVLQTDFSAVLAQRYSAVSSAKSADIVFALQDYKSPDMEAVSCNIGDYIQSIAVMQQLARYRSDVWTFADPRISAVMDELRQSWPEGLQQEVQRQVHVTVVDRDAPWAMQTLYEGRSVWAMLHGWYCHRAFGCCSPFPLPKNVEPIFISLHVHEPQILDDAAVTTLRQNEPIGCRDWSTVYWLLNLGIDAFFSGCLTTTLAVPIRGAAFGESIYVDAVSPELDSGDAMLLHETEETRQGGFLANVERGLGLLRRYGGARSVTTSRLHCYLPCRALGTPVTFVPHNMANRRLDGLAGLGTTEFEQMRDRLNDLLDEVVPMILKGEAVDAVRDRWRHVTSPWVVEARKRLMAPIRLFEREATASGVSQLGHSAATVLRPSVTVVLAFDGTYARHVAPLIRSLRAHASAPLSFVFLVRGVTEADLEAPLRLGNTAQVVSMDDELKNTRIRLSRGTTISTMDRLFLPRVLTGHDRIVYLDVDAVAVGDIVELSEFPPSERGIAARPNPAPQTALQVSSLEHATRPLNPDAAQDLRRLAAADVNLFRPAFNAGVLVLSLKRLRELNFTETCLAIVERFGLQDEQTLNLFSQGDFTEVPAAWNMMPYYDHLPDAKLIHWAGNRKPWLAHPVRFADVWRQFGGVPQEIDEAEKVDYWAYPEHYSYAWEDRARLAASMIAPGSSVLDLGCGRMALRNYLPSGCRYVPADLPKWSAEVIAVDLEADEFPAGDYDVIVILNVLEYISNPLEVIRRSASQGRRLIVSYYHAGREASSARRREARWINDLTEGDLREEFRQSGWQIRAAHVYADTPSDRQIIYVLENSLRS